QCKGWCGNHQQAFRCSNGTGYQIRRFHQCVDETEMARLLRSVSRSPVNQRVELRRSYDAAQDFQGNRGEGDTNKEFRNAYAAWRSAHHAVICGACQYTAPSNGVAIHCSHDRLGVEKDRFEHRGQSREKSLEIGRIFVQEPEEVNASGKYMSSPDEDDGPCRRVFEGCQLCGQRLTELHIEGIRLAVGHMEQGDLSLLDAGDHSTCLL